VRWDGICDFRSPIVQNALHAPGRPRPRVINVDGNPSYRKVVAELKQKRKLVVAVGVVPVLT